MAIPANMTLDIAMNECMWPRIDLGHNKTLSPIAPKGELPDDGTVSRSPTPTLSVRRVRPCTSARAELQYRLRIDFMKRWRTLGEFMI